MERTDDGAISHDWRIYPFTHIGNVAAIVASGQLLCDSAARRGALVQDVGDAAIKDARRRRRIPVGPSGTVATMSRSTSRRVRP